MAGVSLYLSVDVEDAMLIAQPSDTHLTGAC